MPSFSSWTTLLAVLLVVTMTRSNQQSSNHQDTPYISFISTGFSSMPK
jgi:hypothetical protein